MSAATNSSKATLRRLHDAVNTRDLEFISRTVDEVVEPDAVFHGPVPSEARDALKQVWTALLRGFPDIHVAVEDVIAEGDRIVSRNTVTGTHQGEYRGIPASGNSVTYDEIFILRIVGGRIVEGWGVVDVSSQMRQLGGTPA